MKNLCQEIEMNILWPHSEEKARKSQRKINNIKLWDMRYLKNYIVEFNQYYYKIRYNETNLGMFNDKITYQINFIVNEKYIR